MMKTVSSVVDRYFTRYFWTDVNKKPCEDQCVLLHSNGICVLTLAKSHRLLKEDLPIKVNYSPDKKIDRLANKVAGKRKRGGQWVDEMSIICEVTTGSGNSYMLRSCIQGKLIEINENLLTRPELLLTKTETDGYLAVILPPKMQTAERLSGHMLSSSQYEDLVKSRMLQSDVDDTSCVEQCPEDTTTVQATDS